MLPFPKHFSVQGAIWWTWRPIMGRVTSTAGMGLMLLLFVACAGPGFSVRPLQDDQNVLVGLANSRDHGEQIDVRYDHPVEWDEKDLSSVLARVRIQEQGGILDAPRPKREVFSPNEIQTLLPGLRRAFQSASPSEVIVFAQWVSSTRSQALEVTSGGMFLQDGTLHMILANYRERVVDEQIGIEAVRKNPFSMVKEVQGSLLFEPKMYMIASQVNWLAGGFESPAVEVIVDHQAFLASLRRPGSGHEGRNGLTDPVSGSADSSAPSAERGDKDLRKEVLKLKEELSRLKQQLATEGARRLPQESEQASSPLSPSLPQAR